MEIDEGSQFRFPSGWTLGGLYASICLRILSNDITSDCTWLKADKRLKGRRRTATFLSNFAKLMVLGLSAVKYCFCIPTKIVKEICGGNTFFDKVPGLQQ